MGAFMSIVLAIVYRSFNYQVLKNAAFSTVKVTSMIIFILVTAMLLSMNFEASGLNWWLTDTILGWGLGMVLALGFIYVLYFFWGMFLPLLSLLIISLPFVAPIIASYNLSLVWFGIAFVICEEIAFVTPPFGLNLFGLKGAVPKFDLIEIAISGLQFYPAMILTLILLTIFPEIALWLPGIILG